MNSFLKSTVFSFLFLIVLNSGLLAQTYGQLFTKQEADDRFGSVLNSVIISKQSMYSFLTLTNEYIMFGIKDNKAIVLDHKRNPIFPKTIVINSFDVFSMYSVSVVYELLTKGNENTVFIEQRREVLTVTTGGFTMEVAMLCPPICPD